LIRTTGEHPFFEYTKGWTNAANLASGDRLATLDGRSVTVEEVFDTGMYETVYNLRVADWHSYFVGDEGWGFAVWAHNNYAQEIGDPAEFHVISQLKKGIGPAGLNESFEVVGSIANKRGNGIDVILKTESGKYIFVEVKAAARYVSDGSGFGKFQRSFNEPGGGGGPGYVEAQMNRIVDSHNFGTGPYKNLRTGGDYLTGEQAAQIHTDIMAQGGYNNIDVYVARVNKVTSQQVPGTNTYQYTGSDPVRWVQWGTR
jgi:hypothetical protein